MLTYDIFQDQMRRGKVIGALICVADPAYGRIKNSVMDYAEELNVHPANCLMLGVHSETC